MASASLDEPGQVIIPRVNAQLTQGLGSGDFTANLSVPPFGGGLTGRYYLNERYNAELQVQAAPLRSNATVVALLGLQEVPADASTWYYGAQAGTVSGHDDVNDVRSATTVVGASAGYGPFELEGDWRMQVELEANVPLSTTQGDPPVPASRISIGFFRLFE